MDNSQNSWLRNGTPTSAYSPLPSPSRNMKCRQVGPPPQPPILHKKLAPVFDPFCWSNKMGVTGCNYYGQTGTCQLGGMCYPSSSFNNYHPTRGYVTLGEFDGGAHKNMSSIYTKNCSY